ncbi:MULTISPECIES: HutD family protein [unclassified Pseudomonas]|uniref:HutD/Ves family protein n=1 Tax=unclassified Pseudomonas TaxID=196821 RepID=UPI002AC8C65C|nr:MULTISPECIES: HutD family protein [unclassified Pseudomonas]MEB0044742.1 HutD family protein [Pseudomonas sp. Dout3]MEB0096291.1 HutD family protein [Pseudomonas sp. DC1.2]WPX59309.1 HutD family protein [Pseudomonas sp. DC1.2]
MSQLKVLRAEDYPRMPWKNGGGSTEEITRDTGTGLDGFGWRLSIADIAESGGFSTFAGYERVITVLQGEGMTLCVDDRDTRPLLALDPFAFSGESQVSCSLLDGPIRDFNLIYAPQRYRARLQWLAGEQRFFSSAGTLLVFSVTEVLQVQVGHDNAQLGRHDCLQLNGNAGLLEVSVSGQCCVIELAAR